MLKQHQLDTVCSPQPDKDDDTGSVGSASGGSAAAGGSTSPPDSPAVIPITQVIKSSFSSIDPKPINIRWFRTGSQPY